MHWLIALAIILQINSGLWMVDAIKEAQTRKIAYNFYQYHKSLGLIILILSILRLFWRLYHKAPNLPDNMKISEKLLAHFLHFSLYFLMIFIPFLGWVMVSTSSYGLPTMIFGLFEWPHLTFLSDLEINELATNFHKYLAYLMIFLIFGHIFAALEHQFIKKDNLIRRMWF